MNRLFRHNLNRRDVLRVGAIGGGVFALGAAGSAEGWMSTTRAQTGGQDFDRAACYVPFEGASQIQFDAQEGPFQVALSNSYIGNVWRTQMLKMADVFVTRPDIAPLIADWQVASSGEDIAAQIAQTENMISAGAQAIVINAISPTALTPVCQAAVQEGIPVVSFDAIVEGEGMVFVNEDQFEMGRIRAQWLVDTMGDSGKVLMVRGVAGTSVDADNMAGGMSVFEKYPDIETVEVFGLWDPGTSQTVTANALAAHDDITGVWSQGGTDGSVRAFLEADKPLVPTSGLSENGFVKQMLEYKEDGFRGLAVSQSPALVAVAIRAALDLLEGKEVPSAISVPIPTVSSDELEIGVNVFPDQPDNFFVNTNIEACNVVFSVDEVAPN